MIRLEYLSGSLQGKNVSFSKKVVRVGTTTDCDIRFDGASQRQISNYHAAIVLKGRAYFLLHTGQTGSSYVNGKEAFNQQLDTGDRVRFGDLDGPELRVEIDLSDVPGENAPGERYDQEKDAADMARVLKTGTGETNAAAIAELAAKRIAAARAKAGGQRSRNTLSIMAQTLHEVSQVVHDSTRKKWVKVVMYVAAAAIVFISVLGVVVYLQHRQIAALLATKSKLDHDIQAIQDQMQSEQDSLQLDKLEEKLAALSKSAESTLQELSEADKKKAEEAAASGDELEQEIRKILVKFDASTYAIPPIFKERLQYQIDQLTKSSDLKTIYSRKVKYWPVITKEFSALGLPEEMAYLAWPESGFNPNGVSSVGARGMWQMTAVTAKSLGLRVQGKIDDRLDVQRQTHAAARYLANLLAEFGEDSFMLAMASYNRGENGVRRALHQIAQEPGGFKKEKRDFWHLYRLKKLPPETREYVPKILAAVVVCNNPAKYGL